MKFRTSFVTNSSSSNFVIARKGQLNDKQKAALVDFIEQKMLGSVILSPQSTEEEIQQAIEENYELAVNEQKVREALKDGKSICEDWISFEEAEYGYSEIFQDIWDILEKNSDGNFEQIETSLRY